MSGAPTSPSTRRDTGLDSLRGLMLLGMGINHIASLLQVLTDHPLGYTSSAEGFVFLSGLVAGLVYTRRRHRLGPAVARRAAVARAATIYRYHLILLVGLLVWTQLFFLVRGVPGGNTPSLMLEHPVRALVAGIFLINQPPLLDILPMYAGFLLVLPAVLAALESGRRGAVILLGLLGWIAANLWWPQTSYIHGVIQIGAFNALAWQFLFMLGVICGHASATGAVLLRPRTKAWLVWPALAICTYSFFLRHWMIAAPFPEFAEWVNKNNLAPFRLLNTLALFLLVHLAFTRWPAAFSWRPLAFLGRHSLIVYSAHVVVAYGLYGFPEYVSATPARTWLGTAIMVGALYLTAWIHEMIQAQRHVMAARNPLWSASR